MNTTTSIGSQYIANVYTAYDGNFYHVWESNFPSQTGVIRTPYSQDAFNHKKYKTEREAKGDINKRIKWKILPIDFK